MGLNLSLKKTRKCEFLEQMEQVVPWAALIDLTAPFYPEGIRAKVEHPFRVIKRPAKAKKAQEVIKNDGVSGACP